MTYNEETEKDFHPDQGRFLSSATVDILGRIIFLEGSSVHRSVLSNIPGLYPLVVNSTNPPKPVTFKNVSTHCQMSSKGQNKGRMGYNIKVVKGPKLLLCTH